MNRKYCIVIVLLVNFMSLAITPESDQVYFDLNKLYDVYYHENIKRQDSISYICYKDRISVRDCVTGEFWGDAKNFNMDFGVYHISWSAISHGEEFFLILHEGKKFVFQDNVEGVLAAIRILLSIQNKHPNSIEATQFIQICECLAYPLGKELSRQNPRVKKKLNDLNLFFDPYVE